MFFFFLAMYTMQLDHLCLGWPLCTELCLVREIRLTRFLSWPDGTQSIRDHNTHHRRSSRRRASTPLNSSMEQLHICLSIGTGVT